MANKSDWQIKYLKDLCKKTGEYGLNAPSVPLTDKLPLYLRITDITEKGYYSENNSVSVNYIGTKKLLHNNDFLFARTGATVGKTYLNKNTTDKIAFAGYLIRFIPDSTKIHPYFLALYCQTKIYWNWVKICSMRSGQPGISAEEYGKMPVPCPPIEEQRKIVDVLETWDKAINLTKRLIEKKELQKKYLMQQLLTGHTRLKGFANPYKTIRLRNFLYEINERTTSNNQYPIMSVTKQGIYSQQEYFDKQIASKNNIGYKILRRGNIVFSPMNLWMGSIGFFQQDVGIVSPAYKIFNINKTVALFDFLRYFMTLPRMLYLYKTNSEIGASIVRRNLDLIGLLSSEILIPSIKEQQAIARVLSTCDKEMDLLKQKLAKLEEQKKGLMQVLLTGRVRLM